MGRQLGTWIGERQAEADSWVHGWTGGWIGRWDRLVGEGHGVSWWTSRRWAGEGDQ